MKTRTSSRLNEEKTLLLALADQLPDHDQFLQAFSRDITYWQPLGWRGFTQTTRYSYTLEDLSDLAMVRSGLSQGTKSTIAKARRNLTVRENLGFDDFAGALGRTLRSAGTSLPLDRAGLRRLYQECIERGQGRLHVAYDEAGAFQGGVFVVWDAEAAYYLLGTTGNDSGQSGATSLLLWTAIEFAATVTGRFDFEGSAVESIESFFRGFGGVPVPYSVVERRSPRADFLLTAHARLARSRRKRPGELE